MGRRMEGKVWGQVEGDSMGKRLEKGECRKCKTKETLVDVSSLSSKLFSALVDLYL